MVANVPTFTYKDISPCYGGSSGGGALGGGGANPPADFRIVTQT